MPTPHSAAASLPPTTARRSSFRWWFSRDPLPRLCAAGTPSLPVRRNQKRLRPLSGCRRTRVAVVAKPLFSACRPLRSTGITRLHRYYETIRLLLGHRSVVADGPTGIAGPVEISQGKVARLPAAAAPSTVLSRLEIGRRVGAHAHPDRPACSHIHLRLVLQFASSFHPRDLTIPQLLFTFDSLQQGFEGDFHPPRLATKPGAHSVGLRPPSPGARHGLSYLDCRSRPHGQGAE